MNKIEHVVVVGGGLGGANTAFALRDRGYEGGLTIVAEEDIYPYERPPVSKAYLRGEDPIEKAYVRPPEDYQANRIDLLRGTRALDLDVAASTVNSTDGRIDYDALVLATGAAPRRLSVPGADLAGIHYLRDIGDADALRAAAAEAESIVVVGGGWIGAEVAASLTQLGRTVTFLTSWPRPLEHVLGARIADVYRTAHVEHGVRFLSGRVAAVEGDDRVSGVVTADGRRVPADLVVVGVGAIPRSEIGARAALRVEHGAIAVDEYLRTSAPNIYAIGDVARAWNPRYGRPLHLEHWDNAIEQGKTAAANIVGANISYDRVPYLYSDQYDVGMEYRGYAPEWDEVVVRGNLDAREFHAFWLLRGHVAAAMNVNLWDDGEELQALVESNARVDVRRLADAEVPLAQAA
jgi:3-phenylpropionate/trans-cinnamate dioxygenase ferredoxin reductase subunit